MALRVDVNKGPLTLTHDRKYHDVLWYFCAHFIFIKIYFLNMRNRYPYVIDVKTIIFIEFSLLGFYFKFKNCKELFEYIYIFFGKDL